MAKADWKDLLSSIKVDKTENEAPIVQPIKEKTKKQDLIIRFEKRNGKPATIISNFEGSESDLKDLAKELKIFCSTGGSAKDDEILLQGDVRKKVSEYLSKKSFKVRGDIK